MSVEISYYEPEDIGQDFLEAAKFTTEELSVNRALKISNSQLFHLGVRAMRPFFSALSTLAAWLFFVWVMHTFVPAFLQRLLFGKSFGMIGITLLGCVWALIAAVVETTRLTLLLLIDVTFGRAEVVEGRVSPSWTEEPSEGLGRLYGEKRAVYRYIVRNEGFEVNEKTYHLLKSKYDTYTPRVKLYYTPRSKMMLSVEPA